MGKTKEVKVIQANYGYGWDDEAIYDRDEYDQIRHDLAEYRVAAINNPAFFRVITRRVPNI